MVAHLFEHLAPGDVVSYFFCRFDEEESLQAKTVRGCIARQLLQSLPVDKFQKLDHENIHKATLINFLTASLTSENRHFIILDGLDECPEQQTGEIVEFLRDILSCSGSGVKIFGNSRPNPPNWILKHLLVQQYIDLQGAENQRKVASDIERFVDTTLTDYLNGEEPELQLSEPQLVLTIRDVLTGKADGMYVLTASFEGLLLILSGFYGSNFNQRLSAGKIQTVRYCLR